MIEVTESRVSELQEMARRMRLNGLKMALTSGSNGSHLGGSFSCIEIMAVLYGAVLRIDSQNPLWEDRDYFLPSKNHCVLAHFPALAEVGYIAEEELFEFQKDGGRLTGYPRNPKVGLEYSGGSLGMAISVAIGMALAAREKKRRNRYFVLMGDGELDEGSVWEAFMAAAQYKLDNLIVIIDRNHLSYDGCTEDIMALEPLKERVECFGWHAVLVNGHNIGQLLQAFNELQVGRPNIIIADTVKGKGVSFMENIPSYHHASITKEQYETAVDEVEKEDVSLW